MKTKAGKTVLERARTKVARETNEDTMDAESVDRISPLLVTSTIAAPYAATAHLARQREGKEKSKFSTFDRTGRCRVTKGLAAKSCWLKQRPEPAFFTVGFLAWTDVMANKLISSGQFANSI
jgi:hypothetical protein